MTETTKEITREELQEKLARYKKKKGLSRRKLAKHLRIPLYTLYRWDHGLVKISRAYIRLLQDKGVL